MSGEGECWLGEGSNARPIAPKPGDEPDVPGASPPAKVAKTGGTRGAVCGPMGIVSWQAFNHGGRRKEEALHL